MRLPVPTTVAAAGFLVASRSGSWNHAINALPSPTATATVVARKDDTKPPSFVTSITFLTSIAFITAEPSSTVIMPSRSPDTSAPPPPPPAPSTTVEPSITVETPTSSERPPTTTSATATTSLTPSETWKTSTETPAASPTASPPQTSHPDVDPGPWLSKGKIAGIAVGSVFGLILLGLTIYAIFAAYRGINVCDCFGGCFGKRDNDDDAEKGSPRLPSRSEDTYPHPDVLQPASGYRAYRPARPASYEPQQQQQQQQGPLPVPVQDRTTRRLQRGYRGV
ncbi:hypothetical protein BKA58DRAFT_458905 [Alternaria rosae]|uniref:uncharacterized protein n=1 Tax=Alternaria rosae TaxID=1187941 RepID=UPI001E8D4F16|nr:uncharacterized protein BKA58DRAFT_458905 [Alternaria rosae]KAH6868231.1 hypothetical protein BKA58DRAFT_458905 [Alternaria rosae]